jgi:hypothetical protein
LFDAFLPYEKGAIILTADQSLGAWGEVFGDSVIASAILDRSFITQLRSTSDSARELG